MSTLFSFEGVGQLIAFLETQFTPYNVFEVNPISLKKKPSFSWGAKCDAEKLKRQMNTGYKRDARNIESNEEKADRLEKQREYRKNELANETCGEKADRLEEQREYRKNELANETHEQKQSRIKKIKDNTKSNEVKQNMAIYQVNQQIIRSDKISKRKELAEKKQKDFIDEFLEYRNNYFEKIQKSNENLDKNLLNFFIARTVEPTRVCYCCQGMFFPRQVNSANFEKIMKKAEESTHNRREFDRESFKEQICNYDSNDLCKTCYGHIIKGNFARLAANENIRLREIPECVTRLSPLEQIMCSPYIGFVKKIELLPSALNSQLGIRGGVVNNVIVY